MLIRNCTYTASIPYDSSLNTSPLSQAFSGIEVDGISYNIITNPYLDDVTSIQAFLTGLSLGTFTYTFTGGFATLLTYNNSNIVTKLFIITDKAGSPIPWEKPVTQSDCQFLQDPAVVRGCMDSAAKNYNPIATEDDGTCEYIPSSEIDVIRCKAVDNAGKLYIKIRKGDISDYDEKMDCLWWQFAGVDIYGSHTFVGDIVIPEIPPDPGAYAFVDIDFSTFLNVQGFIAMDITIDGVTVWSDPGSYQPSISAYVDGIEAFINSDTTTPDYTATAVGDILTITTTVLGAAQNGLIVLSVGTEDTYEVIQQVDTDPGINVAGCTLGCFVPDNGVTPDEVWFGSYQSHVVRIFAGNIMTSSIDTVYDCNEICYDPDLELRYVCNRNNGPGGSVLMINNLYTIIGSLATNYGTFFCCYNTFAKQLMVTNGNAGANTVQVFDCATYPPVEMGYSPIALPATAVPYGCTFDPATGRYYVCSLVTSKVYIIDSATGVITPFSVGTNPTYACVVSDSGAPGVFELWVATSANAVEVYTLNGVFVTSIYVISTAIRTIKQAADGNVVYSGPSGSNPFGAIRNTDYTPILPNLAIGLAEGSVINPVDNTIYVALPYGATKLVDIIAPDNIVINSSLELDGGADPDDFTRGEVVQSEANNCTDDADINSLLNILNDGTTGCCD